MPEEQRSPDGLPEEEFASLMQSVSAMAPLLKSFFPPKGGPVERGDEDLDKKGPPIHRHCDHAGREALLLALKPYLSPTRCAAVDYLIRLARVGDAIRALQ